VDHTCLQQLLWAVGGLDALTSGRTTASQAAAQQLHRLLKQGWLEGGGGAAGDGAAGDSDSCGEDEDYTGEGCGSLGPLLTHDAHAHYWYDKSNCGLHQRVRKAC
jgi:hypothetical protein